MSIDTWSRMGYYWRIYRVESGFTDDLGTFVIYMSAVVKVHQRFKTEDTEIWALRGRLRRMRQSDIPHLTRLYERVNAGRPMTAIRNRNIWEWMIKYAVNTWLFSEPHVILDEEGRLCGYLTFVSKDSMGIREFVVDDDEVAWRTTLGVLSRRARKLVAETITLPLP